MDIPGKSLGRETLDFSREGRISQGNSWFFGIGINRYQELPHLNNAVKDVQDLCALLCNKYDIQQPHIKTLFNEDATRENIIEMFDKLAENVKGNDKLIIYFSGHGHYNKKTNFGYWIPYDAKKEKTANYIPNATIRDYINVISSRHTLLISDSCFSGSLFVRGMNRSSVVLDELEAIPSRWAICSGRHDEEVYDGEPGGNSPFAQSILDILNRNRRDALNVSRLAEQVVEQTRSNYRQLPEGNPLFGVGHKGGQYIFRLKQGYASQQETVAQTHELEEIKVETTPAGQNGFGKTKYLRYLKWIAVFLSLMILGWVAYSGFKGKGEGIDTASNFMAPNPADSLGSAQDEQDKTDIHNDTSGKAKTEQPPPSTQNKLKTTTKPNEAAVLGKTSKPDGNEDLKKPQEQPDKIIPDGRTESAEVKPNQESKLGDRNTFKLDGKTWLSENLDFDTEDPSWCYANNDNNCMDFGRLYNYIAAKKACQRLGNGWRLPNQGDWAALKIYYGTPKHANSLPTWANESYNFKLGGYRDSLGQYGGSRQIGIYWSGISGNNPNKAPAYEFQSGKQKINKSLYPVQYGLSCRCVKD